LVASSVIGRYWRLARALGRERGTNGAWRRYGSTRLRLKASALGVALLACVQVGFLCSAFSRDCRHTPVPACPGPGGWASTKPRWRPADGCCGVEVPRQRWRIVSVCRLDPRQAAANEPRVCCCWLIVTGGQRPGSPIATP